MKRIYIKSIELQNFKATNNRVIELPHSGVSFHGHNGSGKSSILEAVQFCAGVSYEAERIINQQTKTNATVKLVLSITESGQEKEITLQRTLIPTLNERKKITSSSSEYRINDEIVKASAYSTYINQLFNTNEWRALLNPAQVPFLKSARSYLLSVCGAPSEKQYMDEHFPELAKMIDTDFDIWEKRESESIKQLGKRINEIPGKISELSALLAPVPESVDEAPIHARLEEIRTILKGIEAENATRSLAYNRIACEAQELRTQAQKLRNDATLKVAEANKQANQAVYDVEIALQIWMQEKDKLTRQADQIKAEMNQARHEQADKERQLAESVAQIQIIANECREIGSRVPQADGNCTLCGIYCPTLEAKGLKAAILANNQELDRTKQKGRNEVARRDNLQKEVDAINAKIDGLQAMEHEEETRINAMSDAPRVPERKVIESTPESVALNKKADELEAKASEIIKGNTLTLAHKPTELVDEMTQLNEKLFKAKSVATTQAQNKKIETRISELQDEQQQLTISQLQHQKNIVMLKDFYKSFAESVTTQANAVFAKTGYEIRLFDSNMSNDKGTPVMQAIKDGSSNLSTAESLIFNIRFIERVLHKYFKVNCPTLIDNAECVSDWSNLVGKNQPIIATVEKCPLTIHRWDWPESKTNAK